MSWCFRIYCLKYKMQARRPRVNLFSQARHDAKQGCYAQSFDTYMAIFAKHPELKFGIETEFRDVLEKYNTYLLAKNKMPEIFFNFQRAIRAYPEDADIHADLGRYLYNCHYITDSCNQFQKALTLNLGLVLPEKYLNSGKNIMIPRWHFRMLNDIIRNQAYHDGIVQTIIPNRDKVLDLGTGTGLLSLYAKESNPKEIIACEVSCLLADLARRNFKELKHNIKVIERLSTEMSSDDTGGCSSLLITELFDSALIGERVLEVLEHAWLNLLELDARVLPLGATFYVAAANCNVISSKYRVQNAEVLRVLGIPGKEVHVSLPDDTYDTEDICLHKDIKYVAEPVKLLTFDFNNVEDIQEKLRNKKPYEVKLEILKDTEVDLITGWFDLHITEEISLTTDPRSSKCARAWQQPIFYDFIPINMKGGEILDLKFIMPDSKMTLLNGYDGIKRVSRDMIRFFNDPVYIKQLLGSVSGTYVHLCELCAPIDLNIIDMNPFPLLGFIMVKRGARLLTCYADAQEDRDFIMDICQCNNIPASKIQILTTEKLNEESLKVSKYHLLVSNLLQLDGDMNVKVKVFLQKVKEAYFDPNGISIPNRVTIYGQLIYSKWIDDNNVVDHANTHFYNVAKYFNKSQVSQVFDVDIPHLEYKQMSRVYCLGVCSEPMEATLISAQILEDGPLNALLCWYVVEFDDEVVMMTNKSYSYVNSTLFRIHPVFMMTKLQYVSIMRCVDPDQNFKFVVDRD